MRVLYCLAIVALLSASANAATLRFEVIDSPHDAVLYLAGLSGYQATARLAGGFSITVEPGQPADLHDFDLRLVDVVESLEVPGGIAEGTLLQTLLPIDLETSPSVHSDSHFIFGNVEFTPHGRMLEIPTEPWASMQVYLFPAQANVQLGAGQAPVNSFDGPSIIFRPLAAIVIPEPAALSFAASTLFALSLSRRRGPRRHE